MTFGRPVGHELGEGLASGNDELFDVESSLVGEPERCGVCRSADHVPIRYRETPLDQGVEERCQRRRWDLQVTSKFLQVVVGVLLQAQQYPAAARVQVQTGPRDQTLVHAHPPFVTDEHTEGPTDLVER
jgi:hypothetical protein